MPSLGVRHWCVQYVVLCLCACAVHGCFVVNTCLYLSVCVRLCTMKQYQIIVFEQKIRQELFSVLSFVWRVSVSVWVRVFCGIWHGSHIARCLLALNTLARFSESSTHQRKSYINESYLMKRTETKRQITHCLICLVEICFVCLLDFCIRHKFNFVYLNTDTK